MQGIWIKLNLSSRICKNIMKYTSTHWVAVIFFLIASLVITYMGRGVHSGFILMTNNIDASAHMNNSLLGYSWLLKGTPLHKENAGFVELIKFFCGEQNVNYNYYFVRPLFGFISSLFVPILGILKSMLLVNYIAWLICAVTAWKFTNAVFNDKLAALIAVVLVSGGMGMVVHIGDYSAHMLGYAVYYMGILLLYKSRIWERELSLKNHLMLGVFFALASLAYNSGIMLLVSYAILAVRKNKWKHILFVILLVVCTQRILWPVYMRFIILYVYGYPNVPHFYSNEGVYLHGSIENWLKLFNESIWRFLSVGIKTAGEFLFFDSPFVVFSGIIGFLYLVKRKYISGWFSLVLFLVPISAGMLFSQEAMARGYLIFGVSVFVYAYLAGLLAKGIRKEGYIRFLTIVITFIIVVGHFGWNTAHFRWKLGPVKSYFIGHDDGGPLLFQEKPEVVSLTGSEPIPVLFGGKGSMEEAGAYISPDDEAFHFYEPSFFHALIIRFFFWFYVSLLIYLIVPTKRKSVVYTLLLLVGLIVVSVPLVRSGYSYPNAMNNDSIISLNQGERMVYQVSVSDRFIERLRKNVQPGDQLVLFKMRQNSKDYRQQLFIGETELMFQDKADTLCSLELEAVLDGFRSSKVLRYVLDVYDGRVLLGGWQKVMAPGRRLDFFDLHGQPIKKDVRMLPFLEMRLLRQNDTLKFTGF